MTVYCSGKQGAAVYIKVPSLTNGDVVIYEPSLDLMNPPKWGIGEKREPGIKTFLFESTPLDIRVETFPGNGNEWATWTVYTGTTDANGKFIETARATESKRNDASFVLDSVWMPSYKAYSWRLRRSNEPNTILKGWLYSRPNWITRVVYKYGAVPIFSTNMYIYSAEGFLANTYSLTQQWSAPEIEYTVHCGCDYGKCQNGTFPLKYCCFDCTDSKSWLENVRSNCESYKHEIQDKLLLPRTYNPRNS